MLCVISSPFPGLANASIGPLLLRHEDAHIGLDGALPGVADALDKGAAI